MHWMNHINLLPWREAAREAQKQRFLKALLGTFLGALLCVLVVRVGLWVQLDAQAARNARLEAEQTRIEEAVRTLGALREERKALLDRLAVIEGLQRDRPKTALMLDALTRLQVPGAHFQSLGYEEGQLALTGIAEHNEAVSALMRSLKASPWFDAPVLKGLVEAPDFGPRAARFELTLAHVLPPHPWPRPAPPGQPSMPAEAR
jgi:type IV pilus assembly protein PilN